MNNKTESPWDRIPQPIRKKMIWTLWFITWIGLVVGLFVPVYFEYVVFFSAAHALLALFLTRFQVELFPVQIRIAFFLWVAIGTYVPYMWWMLYIPMVGVASNLFVGYCPLARMMYLFPWNREEKFSLELVWRVFLSPPVVGQFVPRAASG
ncbi:MAG: hypothetical protein LJE84_06130 [Gammaproteobacteria bacterium]|nr:hypothetical protein [Gammaproteobacteria bacterium]